MRKYERRCAVLGWAVLCCAVLCCAVLCLVVVVFLIVYDKNKTFFSHLIGTR